MLKTGAVSRCKPGALDATVAGWISGKESRDAPAPAATSPCRSVRAPAPGADAPGFSSFWELRRSVVNQKTGRVTFHIFSDLYVLSEPSPAVLLQRAIRSPKLP